MLSKSFILFVALSIISSAGAAPVASSPTANASSDNSAACPVPVTVTVTATGAASTDTTAVTVSANGATITSAAAEATSTAASSAIGNFGSCSIPQIKFAVGFDNRKETSFEPVDQVSYNHGSADNIDIITQFMCDTLVNTCGADATAKATCATATTAADGQTPKTGAQADAFNAVFGIKTDFAAVAEIDDQGNVVAAGAGVVAASSVPATPAASTPVAVSVTATNVAVEATSTAASSAIGNFGSCTVPQIKFGTGFDNRKETAFEPVDQVSFNHGSADNIAVITSFICNTLTNTCGADATAKTTCATATTAANAATPLTGAQADAFNAVFGIKTDFAAVPSVSNTGVVVAGTGSAAPAAANPVAASPAAASSVAATTVVSATASAAAPAATTAASTAAGGNLQVFTGSLGGVTPPAVTAIGNGQFQVDGNSAFNNEQNALVRSCDVQHNLCANAANASGNQGALTVSACGDQQTQCNAANNA